MPLFTKLEAENALSQARAEAERRIARPSLPLLTNFSTSYATYQGARKHLPSGASSNIRVHAHDPFPILFKTGLGPLVRDLDDNDYFNLLIAYGALILGHAHPANVIAAIDQPQNAYTFGATTEL